MNSRSPNRHPRIPEQQGIGQTLPPVPVGIDPSNDAHFPPGAMPSGSRVQVQKYQVIIHNFIAEGGFAHVYLARIEGKSGYVVLKRVVVPDNERLRTIEKEIAFMRRLGDHKNIVRYYASRVDPLPTGGYEAFILMEYCPGGGVIDLMNRRLQQRLTEPEILKIFSDVCEALAYMHYCNPPVLHRDLKVENILILSQDHYKLCDFGSAALSKGNYVPISLHEIQKVEDDIQRHTTLQYRAPEMVDIYQKRPINEKADIWALGVLLYKLCYYTTPFEEQGQLAILNARYTIPSQPQFSDGVKRLIIAILKEDPNSRPNIYQVLAAVCHLRGVECPIRNIYPDSSTSPAPSKQLLSPRPYAQPAATEHSAAIFEKLPSPHQQLPEIVPMRRGRPSRNSRPPSQVFEQANSSPSSDPFDPSNMNASQPKHDTPADIDGPFSVLERNAQDIVNGQQESGDSILAFESDFIPYEKGSTERQNHSSSNESDTYTQSNSKLNPKKPQDGDDLNVRNGLASDIEARLKLLKMSVDPPQPSSSSAKTGKILEDKLIATTVNDISDEPLPRPPISETLSALNSPLLQSRNPSSSQQQLSASCSSIPQMLTPTLSASRSSSRSKPLPPPKPARLRASKPPISESVVPMSSMSSTLPVSAEAPPPPKPARSDNRLQKDPSLSDFEEKFPSIEDFYKKFPDIKSEH
ncbi:kinase-like domain-containing protein [Dichotomocladium elegans]|nr:kinase-like domain-containing protein [Dichotomocladium elegans]